MHPEMVQQIQKGRLFTVCRSKRSGQPLVLEETCEKLFERFVQAPRHPRQNAFSVELNVISVLDKINL